MNHKQTIQEATEEARKELYEVEKLRMHWVFKIRGEISALQKKLYDFENKCEHRVKVTYTNDDEATFSNCAVCDKCLEWSFNSPCRFQGIKWVAIPTIPENELASKNEELVKIIEQLRKQLDEVS